jgi:hypothetical protein
MHKKLLVNTLFTMLMSIGYLINMVTIAHPGVAFVMLMACVVGGGMMLSELLTKRRSR